MSSKYAPDEFYRSDVRRYPFQVLSAEGVVGSRSGKPVSKLQKIDGHAELRLSAGHLILVHHSGKFFEYEGDTTIKLQNVISLLGDQIDAKGNSYRPRIEFLYSKDKPLNHDGLREIFVFADQSMTISTEQAGEYCVSWSNRNPNEKSEGWIVTVRNIFDEEVDRFDTQSQQISIDFNAYESPILLFNVATKDLSRKSFEHGVRVGVPEYLLPTKCEFSRAIDALEKAFHTERLYNGYLRQEPHKYFLMAKELSNQPIYAELLANFESRVRYR